MKCSKIKLYSKLSFKFDYRVLSGIKRTKKSCQSITLDGQERHPALGMSTPEMAHDGRKGERTPVKQ
jgi:hypothetical protein